MPVPADFSLSCRKQSKFASGRSPLYGLLFASIADWNDAPNGGWFRDLLSGLWEDRHFSSWFEAPLVIAASLHASVLRGDPDSEPLTPYFTRRKHLQGDVASQREFVAACAGRLQNPNPEILHTMRSGQIQTNEIRRSLCWLLGAAWLGYPEFDLVELGASAGLSLFADQLGWIVCYPDKTTCRFSPEGSGLFQTTVTEGIAPVPPAGRVLSRIGIDRSPLDLRDENSSLWLRALVWPDQTDRMELLEATLAFATSPDAPPIKLQMLNLPEGLDSGSFTGNTHPVIFWNSITTGYFPDSDYLALREKLAAILDQRPGAWLEFELPRNSTSRPEKVHKDEALLTVCWRDAGSWKSVLLGAAEAHVPTLRWFAGRIR